MDRRAVRLAETTVRGHCSRCERCRLPPSPLPGASTPGTATLHRCPLQNAFASAELWSPYRCCRLHRLAVESTLCIMALLQSLALTRQHSPAEPPSIEPPVAVLVALLILPSPPPYSPSPPSPLTARQTVLRWRHHRRSTRVSHPPRLASPHRPFVATHRSTPHLLRRANEQSRHSTWKWTRRDMPPAPLPGTVPVGDAQRVCLHSRTP